MSKRSFRGAGTDRTSGTTSYPTLRAFFARRGRALVGVGLCLLTSGALPGCLDGWDTQGVAPMPPSSIDAMQRSDGGADADPASKELGAADQQPRPDQEPVVPSEPGR